MKKKLLIAGGVTAALLLAAMIFVFTGLGHAIKVVVETAGSAATGTTVTLGSADVSLVSGEGRLTGLTVGNPKGFATPTAFELGDISVKLDTSTVTSDVVVIREIVIEGPRVTYEVGGSGSNIAAIQDNVARFGGSGGAAGNKAGKGGGGKSDAKPDEGGKRFVIKDLYVRNGKVGLATTVLGDHKAEAGLGEIHLRDIGAGGKGATAAEVARALLAALTTSALDSATGLVLDPVKQGAGKVGDALKGLFGK